MKAREATSSLRSDELFFLVKLAFPMDDAVRDMTYCADDVCDVVGHDPSVWPHAKAWGDPTEYA
jgi:hypothetical protein